MKGKRRESAEAYALRLLRIRPRSRRELAQRLRRRGYPAEEVQRVLASLEAAGMLDDREYLEAFILGQIRKLWSRERIERELQYQGFSSEAYGALLEALYDEDAVFQRLLERARRMAREAPHEEALRRRLWNFLARRGHSPETFYRLLQALEAL